MILKSMNAQREDHQEWLLANPRASTLGGLASRHSSSSWDGGLRALRGGAQCFRTWSWCWAACTGLGASTWWSARLCPQSGASGMSASCVEDPAAPALHLDEIPHLGPWL